MHAILIGHVPPARVNSKESWDETCWQKYALWQRQYRDVILGSFYGHMNIDHFMLHDFKQINKSTKKGAMTAKGLEGKSGEAGLLEDGEVTVASASDYLLDLRRAFSKLPAPPTQKKTRAISDYLGADEEEESSWWQKFSSAFSKSPKEGKDKKPKSDKQKYFDKIGGKYAQRYSVNLVSPSVVPNYFPTLRVIEYNITGLEDLAAVPVHNDPKRPISSSAQQPLIDGETISDHAYMREVQTVLKRKQKEADRDATKTKRKYKYKVPKGPQKGSEPGPAYRRQQLTLTGYTQYFANLTRINNDFVSDSVTDNATHSVFGLELGDNGDIDTSKWKEGKHHGHQGKKPRPEPHPAEFAFEVEYDTRTDKMYKLKDLTVRSFVDLGRRIGRQSPKSKALEVESQDDEMDTDIEDSDSDVSDDEFDHDDAAYKDDEELDGESEDGEEQDGEFEHEAEVESKKKHKGKKHKKKKKKHTKNRTWFTFVQRAFVGTMNPDDIEKVFGTRLESDEHDTLTEQNFETMEL
jgi:endopolyphosphatase